MVQNNEKNYIEFLKVLINLTQINLDYALRKEVQD